MAKSEDALDALVEAAARALALPVEPEWRAAIRTHLEINLQHAAHIEEFPLPDEAEPAPVFKA